MKHRKYNRIELQVITHNPNNAVQSTDDLLSVIHQVINKISQQTNCKLTALQRDISRNELTRVFAQSSTKPIDRAIDKRK